MKRHLIALTLPVCGLAFAGSLAASTHVEPQRSRPAHAGEIPAAVRAQASPQATPQATPYVVKGFRSADFGMSAEQVIAAIKADFPSEADQIVRSSNDVDGTTAIAVRLEQLDPSPGTPTVTYVFGATTKRLMHINVVWASSPEPTDRERAALATAGMQLVNYFRGFTWPRGSKADGVRAGPNTLILFAGADANDGGAQIVSTAFGSAAARRGGSRLRRRRKGPPPCT